MHSALSRNPAFHQITFGIVMLTTGARTVYVLRYMPEANARIPPQARSDIVKLFGSGAVLFALGFILWNLDNIFCNRVTEWKHQLGWPLAFLLEGAHIIMWCDSS